MINYRSKGATILMKLFIMNGSVFPSSMMVALPAALLAAALRLLIDAGHLQWLEAEDSVLKETQAWNGFNFLVSFLVVFRTSQSYNRFWDGCTAMHQMRAEWVDACISVFSFTKYSKAPAYQIDNFKGLMVRLMSMMHASALAELEIVNADHRDLQGVDQVAKVTAFDFELIDPGLLDPTSLFNTKQSNTRVELLHSWIQGLIVDNVRNEVLSIPPPLLTRALQEISNGMVAFHDAMKISYIPLPFPYAQACDCLLALHWLVVPFVVSQWVTSAAWAFIFVIIQVFILWALNFIAIEIENPFGSDPNDIDGARMQEELNHRLLMLMQNDAGRTPWLTEAPNVSVSQSMEVSDEPAVRIASFREIWSGLAPLLIENDVTKDFEAAVVSMRSVADFTKKRVGMSRKERQKRLRVGKSSGDLNSSGSGISQSARLGGVRKRLFLRSDSSIQGSSSLPISATSNSRPDLWQRETPPGGTHMRRQNDNQRQQERDRELPVREISAGKLNASALPDRSRSRSGVRSPVSERSPRDTSAVSFATSNTHEVVTWVETPQAQQSGYVDLDEKNPIDRHQDAGGPDNFEDDVSYSF
mmetsp:Transcript_29860/g.69457  ORF Transcript_29860/g.69457 Transcript_29860/m.69457 type:complete len:586 (-) Transcript_29860:77-1834(-)|eukprot:CAMPEP_0178392014 /NCGR_PEP_ID=MMETSP0689_2-20121128/11462_1 /TAXON_ID=160604 /ORGANISM="Amphidinium massartii, Strain CS-259" /LENGTH=585 /DNA_ID=CAMNT_0020012579 /DNA_START=50 /DNA_END=1807 /DNA_ORIENTATION=-